jgi:four helix bundle protein
LPLYKGELIMDKNDLSERLFNFAIDVINYLRCIKNYPEINVVKYQLTKSATSSGANYEEAQGASSRSDFLNKVRIALKEMRESNYWLRILLKLETINPELNKKLLVESEELKKILGAITSKVGKQIESSKL